MAFKCPGSGYEDSEKEFQTEAALKSKTRLAGHLRIVYGIDAEGGEVTTSKSEAREVPIVEEVFTTLTYYG
jgi:hypothetical protein